MGPMMVQAAKEANVDVAAKPTEEDVKIADLIVPYIVDGATLQLGIGGMPNVVGARLAESDLKDLGMHTELCGDAYYELSQAGKLTNRRKSFQRLKGVTGIVFGSQHIYDWVDRNPSVVVEPLEYVNALDQTNAFRTAMDASTTWINQKNQCLTA